MRLQKNATVLVSVVVLLAVSPAVFAGPDLPIPSGDDFDFTGNQSAGIWPASYWSDPSFVLSDVDDYTFTYNVYNLTADIDTSAFNVAGISLARYGADGANGANSDLLDLTAGNNGQTGEYGGWPGVVVTPQFPFIVPKLLGPEVNFDGGDYEIMTSGWFAPGIGVASIGGSGGNGGWDKAWVDAEGGHGGAGGTGAAVIVTSNGGIHTAGDISPGIYALSQGGDGGNGGSAESAGYAKGGNGGQGGSGGNVTVHNYGSIETAGWLADGIVGVSLGGAGGDGGYGGGAWGSGGSALGSGPGGTVEIENTGNILTSGFDARGIFAQSVGGFAGSAGSAGGVVGWGGSGNSAGDGGAVTVTNSGTITTTGDVWLRTRAAIFAQSIGGGGGDAGGSGGVVVLGGTGSAGGNGGAVKVTNGGQLETLGSDAYGILAQSIGGGGGSSGVSGGVVSIGGSANSTGNGGMVTVDNDGAILTQGSDSASIFAQSIGGGGGRASFSGGLVSLGGSGAAGGSGGAVEVTNRGLLQTAGSDSFGIVAQSVGAGGGSGGGSGGLVAIGGSGNNTGNGGTVTVKNSGVITTAGDRSDSIFAQSIGGGGGVAGGHGGASYSPLVSMGGKGGAGGSGDLVTVENSGDLETSGDNSRGVFAQSVGGGGGAGGAAYDVGLEFAFAVGGGSTGGGDGGQIDVDSTEASILTAGVSSHGIHGQSVGGGGGSGGNAYTLAVGVEFSETVAFGGWAGAGGDGAAVDITSGSTITTQGPQAHALYAESLGGGGGSGGNAVNLSATFGGVEGLPGVGIGLSLGGFGGDGGDGQAATIISTGNLTTSGSRSYGAFAQSVGGGGGDGGNSVAGGLSFMSMVAEMAMGGFGGNGGAGNKASVDSAGSIDTQGDSAYGILAQSVGGGGGAGGNSIAVTIALPALQNIVGQLIVPKMSPRSAVGGQGGSGGAGGSAEVKNQGPINTEGALAHGILAQSIGGGGGAGGDDISLGFSVIPNPAELLEVARSFALDGGVKLGSSGGGGGDGGSATVDNRGDITTQEHFATGILVQSVGGGGGVGGLSIKDKYGLIQTQVPSLKLERSAAGSGSGAAVTVDNSADITTHGGFAHGILAQSVGGGGGFAGIKEDMGVSVLDDCSTAAGVSLDGALGFGVGFAGSSGGVGSGGAVTVHHTGSIVTSGNVSHGILAQSAGGSGTGGAVTVALDGDVMADGVDSDGIHAQSVGRGGRGKISVSVAGMVRGGSGAGVGVNLDGGTQNVLINTGHISALSGTALRGSVGDDLIENYGTVFGGVHLDVGANAFNNHAGARLDAGPTIDLGAGNALTNAGILSPGGIGTILDTTLIGDLVLSATSVLEMEIGGLTPGSFDSLNVTGTVTGDVGLLSFAPMMSSGVGGVDVLSLAPAMGSIDFSFLPGFDPASEIGPGGSMTLQFLTAGGPVDWTMMSYSFPGGPSNFRYDVFQLDGGLFLQAVHTVPAPGALLLTGIGLGFLRWSRRKTR